MTELISILGAGLVSFLVAWATIRAEEAKGRAAVYSLCVRYLITAFNAIEPGQPKIRTDPLTKQQHVDELAAIIEEMSSISANPFFCRFVSRNQYVPQMLVQLRRELTEHRVSENFALNQGSIEHILKTYSWCCKLPWGFGYRKHNLNKELVDFMTKWITSAKNSLG